MSRTSGEATPFPLLELKILPNGEVVLTDAAARHAAIASREEAIEARDREIAELRRQVAAAKRMS